MRRRWRVLVPVAVVLLASYAGSRAFDAWRFRAALRVAKDAMARGRFAAAREGLTDIDARWPGRGEVLLSLGLCEIEAGRIDAALDAWGRVAPGSPDAGPI